MMADPLPCRGSTELPPTPFLGDPILTPTPPHSDIRFLGISLRGIFSWIKAVGGEGRLGGLTTTEVVRGFLMPQTASHRGESYCEAHDADASVQRATVFVSHAWSHVFLDFVDALANREAPEDFYWIDFFCNCQHAAPARPFEWWATTFASAIAAIGRTTLVVGFADPKPLSRAWCLFEIMSSARNEFSVAISSAESGAFADALAADPAACIERLAKIDLRRAEASKPEDKAAIFAAVADGVGFDALNERVAARMREWTQSTAKALALGEGDGIGVARDAIARSADGGAAVKLVAADWLLSTGNASLACHVLASAIAVSTARAGKRSVLTQQLVAREALAKLACGGDRGKAATTLRGVWEAKRDALGETDPSTLRSLHDALAVSPSTSVDEWRGLLESQRLALGFSAADTLATAVALSRALCDGRDTAKATLASPSARDEAEALLRSALATATALAGAGESPDTSSSADPLVASICGALAALLLVVRTASACAEALPLLATSLRVAGLTTGPGHPESLALRSLLAAAAAEAPALGVAVDPSVTAALASAPAAKVVAPAWLSPCMKFISPPKFRQVVKYVVFACLEPGSGWKPAFLCQDTTTGALAEALRELWGRAIRKAHVAGLGARAGEAFPDHAACAHLAAVAPLYDPSAAGAASPAPPCAIRAGSFFFASVLLPSPDDDAPDIDYERRAIASSLAQANGRGIAAMDSVVLMAPIAAGAMDIAGRIRKTGNAAR